MRTHRWLIVLAAALAALSVSALPKRRAVSPVIRVCLPMSADNIFINYLGQQTGANPASGLACAVAEPVDFSVLPRGYSFLCDSHTVTWNFSDGTPSQTNFPQSPLRHVFTSAGSYVVTAVVRNSTQQYVIGVVVTVA
jgi:hypothetical protein